MEKILLAINPAEPSTNSLDFACYLARLTRSRLTGVFVNDLTAKIKHQKLSAQLIGESPIHTRVSSTSGKMLDQSMEFFRQGCINREVVYSIHRDYGVPAEELIMESRFADVLVTDAETSFRQQFEGLPTSFVEDLLKDAECPVIIAPASFDSVEEIVFAYNGSDSSMFAIKQFTYLFPQLSNKKVTAIQANRSGKWEDPNNYKFTEWLKDHYTDFHFVALHGDGENTLFDYIFTRKDCFLIMGSYGRTAISQFFKHSTAEFLLKTITQPIFIAHC